jgi:hypothetical protein
LYLKNSKQFPLAIGEFPSEKRLRQQESKLFDGEFVEIRGLTIKKTWGSYAGKILWIIRPKPWIGVGTEKTNKKINQRRSVL